MALTLRHYGISLKPWVRFVDSSSAVFGLVSTDRLREGELEHTYTGSVELSGRIDKVLSFGRAARAGTHPRACLLAGLCLCLRYTKLCVDGDLLACVDVYVCVSREEIFDLRAGRERERERAREREKISLQLEPVCGLRGGLPPLKEPMSSNSPKAPCRCGIELGHVDGCDCRVSRVGS